MHIILYSKQKSENEWDESDLYQNFDKAIRILKNKS